MATADGDMRALLEEQHRRALVSQMPGWLDRGTCQAKRTSGTHYNLRFKCACQSAILTKLSVYVGGETDDKILASKLAQKVEEKHGPHNRTMVSSRASGGVPLESGLY